MSFSCNKSRQDCLIMDQGAFIRGRAFIFSKNVWRGRLLEGGLLLEGGRLLEEIRYIAFAD